MLSEISTGSKYLYFDAGFDITVVKETAYLHFLTLGFRELFIKTYLQGLFLYNKENAFYKNLMFDSVFEIGLDLFGGYGIVGAGVLTGASLGYRVGDEKPSFTVYANVSFSL